MRLGKRTNGISCEYDMQDAFKLFIQKRNKRELKNEERYRWAGSWKANIIEFKDEFHVGAVGRRADFLLVKSGRLINVEAKCNDWKCLLEQLSDHATYCNYCFAYIPDYSHTPVWFKKRLIEKGYGLIIYNYRTKKVTEVLEAHQNQNIDKQLRKNVIEMIRIPKKRSARRA